MRYPALAALALMATACGGEPPAPAATEAPADTREQSAAGVTISEARVQLPVVSGRPGAAYFTVAQANGAPRKITGVRVAMAGRAEMHETVDGTMKPLADAAIEPGTTLKFAPGGKHVMLFELDPRLRFQETVDLTVTLDDGETATTTAAVTTVAEAMEDGH